ncbi:MarR family winged helix-turn-helix transcriptional regulator [Sphaerisporangium corydalis]|uniref:MarR family winged helix-turn-helix transcriptional regulator n=1 Tax=Sphaerisporangium corydalis TaxID=1441875 RepID=A0ABV9ENJ0_9ACTN|nr:MarR family winged helix-turn-helix transcriptional regulator [Sphaerisporangium corydalis]
MTETRWLDEREQLMWRAFEEMRRRLDSAIETQLNEHGLSVAEYHLLVPLSEAPGGLLRARELRLTIDWDRSRLSHQLRRMERRGLVAREDCPTDARGIVIRLTSEGRAAIEAAAPGHAETVRRLFVDVLTSGEIDLYTSIARRVIGVLVQDASEPSRPPTAGPVPDDDCGALDDACPEEPAGSSSDGPCLGGTAPCESDLDEPGDACSGASVEPPATAVPGPR